MPGGDSTRFIENHIGDIAEGFELRATSEKNVVLTQQELSASAEAYIMNTSVLRASSNRFTIMP